MFIELEKAQQSKGVRYYHDLEKQYSKAARAVDKELTVWYSRLAVNNEVSMTEARKMLTGSELEEFRWSAEEYIEKGRTLNISKEWSKQLENASARWHISRLEAMKLQMQQQVEVLYGNELDSFDRFMREIYTDSYYGTAFEIQKGVGIGHNLAQLDTRKIDKVMSRPWAPDGSNFSSRIWKQKTQLVNELNNVITQSFIRGQSPDAAIKHIADRFLVSKGKAANLVMTETAFFHSAGQKDMFKELGVQEYEIVATLDNKTSEICQSLDGTHRPMSEYEPGVTAPPFHCRCRSTTVPYFDDEFTENEVRAARGTDGKTSYVPSDMTYPEWKDKFVVDDTERVRSNAQKMKPLEKNGESSTIKLSINLFDKEDPLYLDALSIEEELGFEDICLHGSPSSVQKKINGMLTNMNASEFAQYLKEETDYDGGDIRLASCETGKGDNSFAQQLSKELGVRVKAPDSDVYYAPDEGVLFVGSPTSNIGKWRIFNNGVEE